MDRSTSFEVSGGPATRSRSPRRWWRSRTACRCEWATWRTSNGEREPSRGTASYRNRPAVVLSVQKQPETNTLELTARVDETLERLQSTLPEGVVIETENFRQADFIEVAIANVSRALRDGAILVVVVLALFLGSLRTTLISALAIPLSLVSGVLVITALGLQIDTMTLGGLTIAIGLLVDDAIIAVENVFRRLKEELERTETERRAPAEVVAAATTEVVQPILFATLIIMLVFLPLFFLPGLEGRLLRPLGLAFVTALAASLVVALTVTPALAVLLLGRSRNLQTREPWLLRTLHRAYTPSLEWCLSHRRMVIAASITGVLAAMALLPGLGRSFLPPFNEGALTVSVVSPPGTPLDESDRLGSQVEEALLAFPEVVSTSRRTGRAERDEHVQGVSASELEVVLAPLETGRSKDELVAEMRRAVSTIPGTNVSFGQPISHRIDHMISGSKTNLAVKVFGPDLTVLRSLASRIDQILGTLPGIVDLSNQEQAAIPQLVIDFDRTAMARYGLLPADLADAVEALFQGFIAGEITEHGLTSDVAVRLPPELRSDGDRLAALPITTPTGDIVRLGAVAQLRRSLGPSLIRRENVQRVAMLTANVEGTDLAGTVEMARAAVDAAIDLPTGYLVTFGGQFEEAGRSARTLALLGVLILFGMYGLLYLAFPQPPRHSGRARQPAAGPDRRHRRGRPRRWRTVDRHPGRLRDPLRRRHPQWGSAGQQLPTTARRRSEPRRGGAQGIAGEDGSDPHDRPDRRIRSGTSRPLGRRPRQRDPEPDGPGHPWRSPDLDLSQSGRRAGALPCEPVTETGRAPFPESRPTGHPHLSSSLPPGDPGMRALTADAARGPSPPSRRGPRRSTAPATPG